nr:sodium channel protein type 4 subunit alpha B-like [Nerophis lumbriciformis]
MEGKTTFWDFWGTRKEQDALARRISQRKPLPSHLGKLLGNSAVRAQLGKSEMVALLPPVGTEVFRKLTRASLEEIREIEGKEDKILVGLLVAEKLRKPSGDLESGKPLPFIFGEPAPEFVNIPLEELDPFYQSQKTFVVLDREKILHRFNADSACCLLTPFNLMRTTAIRIVLHSFFRAFILLTVLTNCVFLTMAQLPEWSKFLKYAFIAIYTLEALVKLAARGFCVGRFTFLWDPCNWLDLMVICTAYLTEIVAAPSLSAFQVLPALKIITAIPGLKRTLGELLQSMKKMGHVVALSLVTLGVLATLALHNFMGFLRQKCVLMAPSNHSLEGLDYQEHINNPAHYYYLPEDVDALLCGNRSDAGICPEGYTCLRAGRNPNYGYTGYDSFGWAFLALFRLATQDFWENLYQLVLRSAGKWYTVYFVVDLALGSFCLGGLIVATLAAVSVERKWARMAEDDRKDKEFVRISQLLKKKEEQAGSICLTEMQHSSAAEEGDVQKPRLACCSIFTDIFLKWSCCSRCWAKRHLCRFVNDPFFDLAIVICIVLNTIFMAMEHFPLTQQFYDQLSLAGLVFTIIFTGEVALKLLAMGPYCYFQVAWNIFDSVIVALTLLEFGLPDMYMVSALGRFSVLRVFRLARWWPSFNALLKFIAKLLGAARHSALLLAVITLTLAAAGMRLFGKNYKDYVCRISQDCRLPRWHMSDFFHAAFLVFRALCGEWIETMWDCMEVAGQPACLAFYAVVVVVGRLAVLNLFLALLMNGDHRPTSQGEGQNNLKTACNRICGAMIRLKSRVRECTGKKTGRKTLSKIRLNPPVTGLKSDDAGQKEFLALTFVSSETAGSELEDLGRHQVYTGTLQTSGNEDDSQEKDLHNGESSAHAPKPDGRNVPVECFGDQCYECCPILNMDSCPAGLRIWTNVRKACLSVVENKYFRAFVTLVILMSSATLAIEDVYLEKRLLIRSILEYADLVFTCVFVLEMFLKWFADGLKKYFTDAWCLLDFLIVLISLLSTVPTLLGVPQTPAVQSLRTLRPLRVLSRFEGLKVVTTTLIGAIPFILDVLLACLTLWLIFSITGVRMFAGKFMYCYNGTSEEYFSATDVDNRTECLVLIEQNFTEVRWKNTIMNFDNVAIGYLSLLQVATFKGWMDIIYAATDSKQIERQPEYEANVYKSLYFVIFIIFGSFVTFNFLIGAIIEYLKQRKAKIGGTGLFMTTYQMKCYNSIKRFRPKQNWSSVPRPQNKIQALLFDLVTKASFDIFFMVFACLQVILLAVETSEDSIQKDDILHWMHFVIIVIFTVECVLKIAALRKHYFTFGWNIFDFVLVILFIVGLFLADLMEKYFVHSSALFGVIRLTRVCRILHLLRVAKGVRRLILVLMRSLPALLNIGFFLFLVTFTFSVFGMKNFAHVKKGAMLDDMFNFETFANGALCMFAIGTSAGWDGLLLPLMSVPPDCNPYTEHTGTSIRGDCGRPAVGVVFVVSYISLSFLVVVCMYVVVLLENFKTIGEESADELARSDFQMFGETWKKFDPQASHLIHSSQLSDFCDDLKEPLRMAKPNGVKVAGMDLPLLAGDNVYCVDLLVALVIQARGISGEMDKTALKASMEEKFLAGSQAKDARHYEPISSTLRRKREDVAAAVIQKAYRRHATRATGPTGKSGADAYP